MSDTGTAQHTSNHDTNPMKVSFTSFCDEEKIILFKRLRRLAKALDDTVIDIGRPGSDSFAELSSLTQERLSRWFGNGEPFSDTQLEQVRKKFATMKNTLETQTLGFENVSGTSEQLGYLAVNDRTGLFFGIRLSRTFYDENSRRQIGVLFHELTHRFLGTRDYGYIEEDSLRRVDETLNTIDGSIAKNRVADPNYYKKKFALLKWSWEPRPRRLTGNELLNNADTFEGFLEDFYLDDVPTK